MASCPNVGVEEHLEAGGVHGEVSTIGLEIAKSNSRRTGHMLPGVGCSADGSPGARSWSSSPASLGTWWHWRHAAARIAGHGNCLAWVRSALIPPAYVKPLVKQQKSHAADAEAICEAARRSNTGFAAVKIEEQQASRLVFRTRYLLVRQRTPTINAIRGHMAEYGWVAPRGPSQDIALGELIDGERGASLLAGTRKMMLRSTNSTRRSRGRRVSMRCRAG